METMKTYTIFWLTGKAEVIKGNSISNAFSLAGYSISATKAIDFYSIGDERDNYVWNTKLHTWKSK